MQPTALGRIDGHLGAGAARQLPQRQAEILAAPVPQCRVNRRQRQTRDGAHMGGVSVKEQVLPNPLDAIRILSDETRQEMISQQGDDRRAPGADGVRIAHAFEPSVHCRRSTGVS